MSDWAGRRVLVTGGAGFIGAALTRALIDAGADVTVADHHPSPHHGVRSVVGDLRDRTKVDEALQPGMDGVFHLAAFTSVLRSLENPAEVYESNVGVTAALLECARQVGAGHFLFASTNAVVGEVGGRRIVEDLPLRPLTPYGATKAAAEMLLSAYDASYGMKTGSLRLTNVYGPGMGHKDSIVPRLMRAALSGRELQIYGDGEQVRDYVHVSDVVRGLMLAWEAGSVGPVIIGSGRSVSVNEMFSAARAVTGAALPATHVPRRAGEMSAVVVDISRARSLGYRPTLTLERGLATAWGDFCRQREAVPSVGKQR